MDIVSFFAGAGGLDLGFSRAGFNVVWANEYDKDIWQTYEKNHPHTRLDKRSIVEIDAADVPDCDGIIGGPPCQSWSAAGALRGITDKRGQLFFDFIRILKAKRPKFFLAENVAGMLQAKHKTALENIISMFEECGYTLSLQLLNASDFGIPQDRKRLFFVGYRDDLGRAFQFPEPHTKETLQKITLADAISDLQYNAVPAKEKNYTNKAHCIVPNHEYMIGGFSSIYMSRNRVRHWHEPSFTIQAGARHAPMHPQAPKMLFVEKDKRMFVEEARHLYRRLTVRECARIQTFPDDFLFCYEHVAAGYKMVGNAVPVLLAEQLARVIGQDLNANAPCFPTAVQQLERSKITL